jgi:hypothetical protein
MTLHAALMEEYPDDEQRINCMIHRYREMDMAKSFLSKQQASEQLQGKLKEIEDDCETAGIFNATFFVIIAVFSVLVVGVCYGLYFYVKRKK